MTKALRAPRCGVCAGCRTPACGECVACADRPKFGGEGRKRRGCVARRCARALALAKSNFLAPDDLDALLRAGAADGWRRRSYKHVVRALHQCVQ
jgi:hypothetical protein